MNVLDSIASRIQLTRDQATPYLVGITGMDAAGKTRFAEDLKAHLASSSFPVTIVHLDDFHNPKAVRYAGVSQVDNYLSRSIDFALFEERVLIPLRRARMLSFDDCLLDLDTDQYSRRVTYEVSPGDVVIIEGVFLFRKPWRQYFDLRIFLKVAAEVAIERGVTRDADRVGHDVRHRYENKYMPAQALHFATDDPEGYADLAIDNNDFDERLIVTSREA